ncbi:uncharacterized protein [Battus philenor]|uniref:uncharacterized protein n=1 Tax=Battus philenor TaxID=42288 RepID=UPI0035D10F88
MEASSHFFQLSSLHRNERAICSTPSNKNKKELSLSINLNIQELKGIFSCCSEHFQQNNINDIQRINKYFLICFNTRCDIVALQKQILEHIDYMQSLRLIELRVPAHTNIGSEPELICRWDLGDLDVLYSVKWYKDGKEFFRHVPRDFVTHRKFYLPGVKVKKSDALGSNITLSPATLDTEGRYRCEVSGERPLFPTVSDHADMFVVVLPEYGPVMTGFKTHYRIGDQVHVNCTCGPSRPVVRLAWYLNGEPAPLTTVTSPLLSKDHKSFDTSSLTLTFKVTGRHFLNGELKVKCLATLASIYWKSSEESAQGKQIQYESDLKKRIHAYFI